MRPVVLHLHLISLQSRGGVAEALTSDHRPSREDEKDRIETLGGYVDLCRGVWRIQGSLAVSRGIRDRHLKQWVTAEPETKIKSGLWVNPRVPEMIGRPELESLAKTYGKFWCTWQVDRGDRLPLGAPALMMSPQAVSPGLVRPDILHERDSKYKISSESLKSSWIEIPEPEMIHPMADYWKQHGKGFVIDFEETVMKKRAPFP